MKKRFLLSILMLICILLLLTACGKTDEAVENSVPSGAESSVDSTETEEPDSNSGEVSIESGILNKC